ncbi:recombinase family protein [Enterobacter ludwigii]|uniref:recombinase family protein n=1 Tax=Enterobacter ludwigii TaxID=299767 RepID=UPI00064304E5|nr:recombinase family protein [Enterobacter ludwigii]KLR43203.1 recombinase [Enterobacter ludwigii]
MSDTGAGNRIAAQYLRMSTEHQKYSPENQREYIEKYAKEHSITIQYTYDDAGRSGLSLDNRPGLRSLLHDVENGIIKISLILVYDASRFGRFQDIEEAAHYSWRLKCNGVRIIYCAEPFSEEQTELYMLGLSYSRYGAATYSKNLSEKVFLGQANLVRRGYHQGGVPGYGIRRLLIDEHTTPKGLLLPGQRKSLQTDRVILIPGPPEEVAIVNKIYDMFIDEGKPEFVIASELNRKNIPADNGQQWSRGKIHQILTNEKYIGNNVYNRTSGRLKTRSVRNPQEQWIRCDGAWEPVVSAEKFEAAKRIIAARAVQYSDDELLDKLRHLLKLRGRLSGIVIDEEELFPSSSIYRSRFGGLVRAYSLIGYNPRHDYSYLEIKKQIAEHNLSFIDNLVQEIYRYGGWGELQQDGSLYINDEFFVSANLVRCQRLSSGKLRWKIKFNVLHHCDVMIFPRLDSTNNSVVDYFMFPAIDVLHNDLTLHENNGFILELYRFDDLSCLEGLVKRTKLEFK